MYAIEKEGLPQYSPADEYAKYRTRRCFRRRVAQAILVSFLLYTLYTLRTSQRVWSSRSSTSESILSIDRLNSDYAICAKLRAVPEDPSEQRQRSSRYVDGHQSVLIRNATVWTGGPEDGTSSEDARSGKGYSWISADVLMENGLIKRVESGIADQELPNDCAIYDAHGRQLTSGLVDMHSHTSVDPLPDLRGWSDSNEMSHDISPFVRSIDGLNPLDHQIQVIKSGGVTTSLILPGSGNNMGGEAYVIKHAVGKADGRLEISAEDMLADPDKHWRYMKMACGENPKRVYGRLGRDFGPYSRMGEAWYFRHAFEEASALVASQDDWCDAAAKIGVENMATYLPQELKWESLGALLRGQVLLNVHCYTVPDLEAFVHHTNEFNFSVRAFHHAHQTYLVPEILKRTYGGRPPAAALFADAMYYKAESYIGSEQAGKTLWENDITPVYVSDNPVINAQHVVFEAAKAYKNGLPYHVALAGVTSASAELLGLGQRVGKVKAGFDADIVVWDSDPLSVGATPVQVWIDGVPQFEDPVELKKPSTKPIEPNQDLGIIKASVSEEDNVVFSGVTRILIPGHEQSLNSEHGENVVIVKGFIKCIGHCHDEIAQAEIAGIETIALRNGHIAPDLTAFGSSLGLVEIEGEADTQDGFNKDGISRTIDGLALDGKSLKAAYSHGVTKAITSPLYAYGGHKGVSAGFLTGALSAHEQHAVFKDDVALHYTITNSESTPSISSAVGELRTKLLKAVHLNETSADESTEDHYLQKVVKHNMPLAITVHSADIISSLLRVKSDVETAMKKHDVHSKLQLVLIGGAESWMLADALSEENIAVVLAPMQAYSLTWDQRRSLPGAPSTDGTAINILHAAGVKVAIGTQEDWETRDLFLTAGIAFANGNGKISEKEALAFVSSNIDEMLGIKQSKDQGLHQFTVFSGNPLTIDSQIRAVADGRGKITVWS